MIAAGKEATPEERREFFEIELEKCKEILGDIFKEYTSIWETKDKEDEKMPEKDFLTRHYRTLETMSKIFINADLLLKNKNDWNLQTIREIVNSIMRKVLTPSQGHCMK